MTPDHPTSSVLPPSNDGASSADGPSAPVAALHIGAYEVLDVLGRGGMGIVYRARHRTLGHEVALKMILPVGHAGEHEKARFLLEATAVARLRHPGIVRLLEHGYDDGKPFFALELVPGGS